jgi:hypothetical protein
VRDPILTLLTAAALVAAPHHATAVQYDTAKTIELKGVITKLDWANPHVHVYLDVKGDSPENWNVEFGSPGAAIIAGVMKDSLKPGTTIKIKGYPAKTVSPHAACATEVTLPDGLTAHFVVGI